jgi:superfamily II DNA/RNA helicase
MNEPEKILVKKEKLSLQLIGQYYIDAEEEANKILIIEDLYSKFMIGQAIIYVSSIHKAEWLAEELTKRSYTIGMIHSKLDPIKRLEVMKLFRATKTRVLISTDLTARGIDVQQVGIVINYDLPYDVETYLHRIGRSGRFNKKGVAISLISSRQDRYFIRKIEQFYGIRINVMPEVDIITAFLAS